MSSENLHSTWAGLLSKINFFVLQKDFAEDHYIPGELINFCCAHERSIAVRKISMLTRKEIASWKNRYWTPKHSIKNSEKKESEVD